MAGQREWGASFASAPVSSMRIYDKIMVPRLFDPWAELLLDTLQLQNGQSVLDVACGPGTVTRLAAQSVGLTGRVTGCDFSPAMLEIARAKISPEASAPIEYVECPADSLRVPDNAFDVVTCQQGLQFFPDRPAALAEMRRALRPGGQLGIATWCAIGDCPPFAALATALEWVLGAESAVAYESGPWGFSDADSLLQLVSDGGFTDVEVHKYELPLAFEGGPEQLLQTLRAASVATALAELSEDDFATFAAAVEEATRPMTVDGIVRSHASSHILTAHVGDV
jgi:SAM-dependent methyltransferase